MNQELIWDYFQTELVESFRESRARLLFLAKKVKRGGRVLNIGVGAGIFEEITLNLGLDVHSLDPSSSAIAALQQRLGIGVKAKVGYGQEIPFPDEYFDAVVASEVLEHLTEETASKVVAEVARVLVKGGSFLGTVPARENLREQLVVCPKCGERFHRWGHQQSFDPSRIRALMEQRFRMKEIIERAFPNWPTLNWKRKLAAFARQAFRFFGQHSSSENIYFHAQKK
jgi:ubiquinone/menaquinone biosynthesis C-methylase UbiE